MSHKEFEGEEIETPESSPLEQSPVSEGAPVLEIENEERQSNEVKEPIAAHQTEIVSSEMVEQPTELKDQLKEEVEPVPIPTPIDIPEPNIEINSKQQPDNLNSVEANHQLTDSIHTTPTTVGEGKWEAESHEVDKTSKDLIAWATTYENQRWYPVAGWTGKMLVGERGRWTSKDGLHERQREHWPIPGVWGHPSSESEWRDFEWTVDVSHDSSDPTGWTYAFDFRSEFTTKRTSTSCVRRRRWRRAARVKPTHMTDNSRSKFVHSVKCACLNTLQKHEQHRCEVFSSEIAGTDSLKGMLGMAIIDARDSSKLLLSLKEHIGIVRQQQQLLAKVLRSSRSPTTVSDSPNPVVSLFASINNVALAAADKMTGSNGQVSDDTIQSLSALASTIGGTCDNCLSNSSRAFKKLQKQHEKTRAVFLQLQTVLTQAKSCSKAGQDAWNQEREYGKANFKFATAIQRYKEEVLSALTTLNCIEEQCLDMINTAAAGLRAMLEGVGVRDLEFNENNNSNARKVPNLDTRCIINPVDVFESQLISRKGPLKLKTVLGWKEYHGFATVDSWLHLTHPLDTDKLVTVPVYSLNLVLCTIDPIPSTSGVTTFILREPTVGAFGGDSERHYKLRANSEQDMVDWLIFLKVKQDCYAAGR